MSLNKEESNPWIPPATGNLISPPGTPDIETLTIITPTKKQPLGILLEELLDRPLRDSSEGGSDFRFRPNRKNNLFNLTTNYPPLLTFPT